MGVIIQKKDGGYLYTTDIACAKYRYETPYADRVLYYIDSRQHQHLMQAWAIVRKAGYVPESTTFRNHMFGMMLAKMVNRSKPALAVRKLADLLDEATGACTSSGGEKNGYASRRAGKLANAVGIGAVKYADLSKPLFRTTSSTGTTCWRLRVIPRHTCSMLTRVYCPCSVKQKLTKSNWQPV